MRICRARRGRSHRIVYPRVKNLDADSTLDTRRDSTVAAPTAEDARVGRREALDAQRMATPTPAAAAVPLPQLVTDGYRATTFEYDPGPDAEARGIPGKREWIEVFRASVPEFRKRAASDPRVADAASLADVFAAAFDETLNAILRGDHAGLFDGEPTVLKLCALRDAALSERGFEDCFADVKAEENDAALLVLPSVLAEIDGILDARDRLLALVRGAFAGNVFDLGAAASAKMHADGDAGFHATRAALKPRPWCVDDFDALAAKWVGGDGDGDGDGDEKTAARRPFPYKKCVMFVDNAGADVVLGMLPLARELTRRGCDVTLAANETPPINDITARELTPLIRRVAEFDPATRAAVEEGRLRAVSSGSDLPVIDLTKISPAAATAAAGADLIVLEGMGRAIETNLNARFTVDVLKLGMVKHPEVATCLGGTLYDCVCKFG